MQAIAKSQASPLRSFLVTLPAIILSIIFALGASRYYEMLFWVVSLISDMSAIFLYKWVQRICQRANIHRFYGDLLTVIGQLIFWLIVFMITKL